MVSILGAALVAGLVITDGLQRTLHGHQALCGALHACMRDRGTSSLDILELGVVYSLA